MTMPSEAIAQLFAEKPPVLVEVRFPKMGTSSDWFLCDDEDDLEPRVEEGLERGDRELRGAEEGDPHHSPAGAGSVGCSWT